jgi:peptide/nickel transport system ATP-binding protein
MYAGQVVEQAPAAEFFAHPRHPYARALLKALPDAARRSEPLAAISGTVPALWQVPPGCRFAPRCGFSQPACTGSAPMPLAPVAPAHWVRCVRQAALAAEAAGGSGTGASASAVADAPPPAGARAAITGTARGASEAPAEPLLRVQDLRVRYAVKGGLLQRTVGHFDAVGGVSFSLAAGQTVALVGESGSGKTTTGKAIAQLLRRQAAVSGHAWLDGRDLCSLHGEALLAARREVQLVFQDPFASLNPRMRVSELLQEGLVALCPALDAAQRQARITTLCEQVGLRPDALARYPHEFSGGQRQRIAIARALAVQPRLLVCDEPTSALDVSVQAQILNLLRQLQRELGVAYLFITHNLAVVECLADAVVVMQHGRVVEQGPVEAVLGHPTQPYTQQLLAAVPRLSKG